MSEATIDDVLGEQHDAIVTGVQARMRGEATMGRVPFDDALVLRMFNDISTEINARLGSPAAHGVYAAYRDRVTGLILAAFPHTTEG